jgi:hypothetical protein
VIHFESGVKKQLICKVTKYSNTIQLSKRFVADIIVAAEYSDDLR